MRHAVLLVTIHLEQLCRRVLHQNGQIVLLVFLHNRQLKNGFHHIDQGAGNHVKSVMNGQNVAKMAQVDYAFPVDASCCILL